MTNEQQFIITHLRELRDKSINSYQKRMYSKQIKNVEKGLCPYGCIDWKKEMEEERDKMI